MTPEQVARSREFASTFSITSFTLFMAYKGEEGYRINIQGVDDELLYEAFEQMAGVPGGIVLVHAENQELAAPAAETVRAEGRDDLGVFADSPPWLVEAEAVQRAARLAEAARFVRRACDLAPGIGGAGRAAWAQLASVHRDRGSLPDRNARHAGRRAGQGDSADP